MTRLGALVARPPVFVAADAPVREAAAAMTAAHTSAALVETGDGVGDRHRPRPPRARARRGALGGRPGARRRPPGADRARRAHRLRGARRPARRRPPRAGRDRRATGGSSACSAWRTSPAARSRRSRCAARSRGRADEDALVATLQAGLPRLLASLLSAGLAPADVSRALAVQSDTATLRLVDLAFHRHGPAPVAWAWLALGSVARRELTLASDQDNALAYADEAGPRRRRVLRARGGRRQRRAGPQRHGRGPRRGPRARPALADVAERVDGSVRAVPRAARPLAPRPRGRELRLPPRRRRPRHRPAARGGRARRAAPSRLPRAPGAHGDGLEGRPRPARPGPHRPRRARST